MEITKACIKLAHGLCSAQRTKSMDVKYHFLRQAVQEGKTNLKYIDTKKQLADISTKQLPVTQFVKLRTAIGRRYYQWKGPRPGGLTLSLRDSRGTEVRGWSSLALAAHARFPSVCFD